MNYIKSKITILLVALLFITNICACAKNDELETYKSNMESFFSEVSNCNDAMNNIDPDADDAPSQLLTYIDKLDEEFAVMASYDVPKDFQAAETLADEAADNMSKAALSYHEAYDGDFDAQAEATASQYYERAFVRVSYIITILHGEIPEGDGVTVITQDADQIEPIDEGDGNS